MSPAGPGGSSSDGMALAPVVKVGGTALATEFANALSELRVRVAVRTIGRCTVRFDDHDHELVTKARFTIGSSVQVLAKSVHQRSAQTPIFDGTVTSVSIEQRPGRTAELVVVAEDAAWGLSRGTKARTFLDSSYSDVVSTVLQSAGLTGKVTATTGTFPYLLQTDTDLAFIDEISRRCGFDWVVGPDKTFHFWPSWNGRGRTGSIGSTVRLTAGESLDEFSVKVSSDSPEEVTVRGWDRATKQTVVGKATATVSLPSGLQGATGLKALQKGTVVDGRSGPSSQADATTLATAAVRDGGVVTARGRTWSDPALTPGGTVDLQGIGPASGAYFVHEVEHVYRHSGFTSSFVAGDRHVPSLADAAAAGAPAVSSFFQRGLVPALVTNVNDEKHPGEAKVKFSVLGDTIESDWARVATIGGGADRGMSFIPEVNDEVLVGFEGGDVRHPVVLGGLFNGKDAALAGLVGGNGAVEARRIRSRLGHVVELGDGESPDKKHILLALGGGKGGTPSHKLRLGQDKVDLTVPDGVPLTITVGSSSIEMDGKGAVTIKGTTITLKAEAAVNVEGTEVSVKGQTKVAVEGTSVQVKGQAAAALESGGQTVVKGAMVMIN